MHIGGPAAQAGWLGPKFSGHLVPFLYSSHEPSELSQWLCYDDSIMYTPQGIHDVVTYHVVTYHVVVSHNVARDYHKMIVPSHAPFSL